MFTIRFIVNFVGQLLLIVLLMDMFFHCENGIFNKMCLEVIFSFVLG